MKFKKIVKEGRARPKVEVGQEVKLTNRFYINWDESPRRIPQDGWLVEEIIPVSSDDDPDALDDYFYYQYLITRENPKNADQELSYKVASDEIRGVRTPSNTVSEARKPMRKAQKKEQWWFDIPGAKHIYHGDWSDPEIQYKGFSINYWDVIEGMSDSYREEHPEDKEEKGFDAWMETQGGPGGYLEGELDNCIYAALGDDSVEEEPWLGIPDAYKVKEVYGQGEGEFILYKDCLVNVADVDYYDSEYDDWYPYSDNPEKFEEYYSNPKNKKELVDKLNKQVSYYMSESTKFNENWLGDKVKAGWNKVKDGAKKVGKAIGDAFNGPFRKGDQIVMKGEDGESFKGTITDYSMSDRTYEVMLGKPTNEGLQEDVLDMADREDELVWMIQEKFWDLAEEADPDSLRQLIENCVELEKVKPGRLQEIINEEF